MTARLPLHRRVWRWLIGQEHREASERRAIALLNGAVSKMIAHYPLPPERDVYAWFDPKTGR